LTEINVAGGSTSGQQSRVVKSWIAAVSGSRGDFYDLRAERLSSIERLWRPSVTRNESEFLEIELPCGAKVALAN
jgi:hypothetical protein